MPLVLDQYIDTYPRLQLLSIQLLIDGLKLTDSSRLDHWNGSWNVITIASVLVVEKGKHTLLKIRPSLLEELHLEDCPGLERELARQPRVTGQKCPGHAAEVVSPVKVVRTASTPSIAVALQTACESITNPDSEIKMPLPPSLSTLANSNHVPEFPIVDAPSAVVDMHEKKKADNKREWLLNCPLSTWLLGWEKITKMLDDDPSSDEVQATGEGASYRTSRAGYSAVAPDQNIGASATTPPPPCINMSIPIMAAPLGIPSAHFVMPIATMSPVKLRLPGLTTDQAIPGLDLGTPLRPLPTSVTDNQFKDLINYGILDDIATVSQPFTSNVASEFGMCSFCDEPFLVTPSEKLVNMQKNLESCTFSSPSPANPNHRVADSFLVFASFCKQH
ncbi:hypothetical protein C8J57DRAFT_1542165 [Mycena rebaudengoi]|nr:hypothetical protein C8J57DRAFT_1542165 [Mycena rebaudengoi]